MSKISAFRGVDKIVKKGAAQMTEDNPESKPQRPLFQENSL